MNSCRVVIVAKKVLNFIIINLFYHWDSIYTQCVYHLYLYTFFPELSFFCCFLAAHRKKNERDPYDFYSIFDSVPTWSTKQKLNRIFEKMLRRQRNFISIKMQFPFNSDEKKYWKCESNEYANGATFYFLETIAIGTNEFVKSKQQQKKIKKNQTIEIEANTLTKKRYLHHLSVVVRNSKISIVNFNMWEPNCKSVF